MESNAESFEVLSRSTRFSVMKEFLHTLFDPYGGEGYLEMRAIKPEGVPKRNFCPLADMDKYSKDIFRWAEDLNKSGYGIYIGVLPRCRESGKKTDILKAAWLWADLDFKVEGEGVVFSRLEKLPADHYPDMIVLSGNGVHAYAKLDRVVDLSTVGQQKFEAAVRGFQKEMQPRSDATHDVSRVLRLPGFYNTKNPQDLRLVQLVPTAITKAITSHAP